MIEIFKTLKPTTEELAMLNLPFEELLKKRSLEKDHQREYTVGPYHDITQNETNWLSYEKLGDGIEIVIASSKKSPSYKEMFDFMTKNNGFAMFRNNLFMFWEIYREQFSFMLNQVGIPLYIVAIAHPHFLPEHKSEQKICPMLEIEFKKTIGIVEAVNYSFFTTIEIISPVKTFVFFRNTTVR